MSLEIHRQAWLESLPFDVAQDNPLDMNRKREGSLEVYRQAWLEGLRVRSYAAMTLLGRYQSLARFFDHLRREGIEDLREVTPATVAAFQAWLMEPGRYAPGTVAAHLSAVCLFFRYLVDSNALLVNPCARIVIPKLPRRLPRAVPSRREARVVLRAPDPRTPKGLRDRALLELFYSSGLRLGEMTNLAVSDVDLRHRVVRVRRGKGRRDRVSPIGERAGEALQRYLREARPPWLHALRCASHDALWLSPIQPHQPLKKEAVARVVRQLAQQSLGRTVSPHAWRHAFATHLVSAGAPLAQVQQLLGHRSIKTTQIYTRVTLPEIRRSLRRAHPRSRLRRPVPAAFSLRSPFQS